MKETDNVSVTGLDQASNRKEAEYDLVTALLSAAEYKTADDNITEVEMKRNGKYLFTVHLHPISDNDARQARKKATIYMPNPNNKKLPPVEKDFDTVKFNSWLIYLATTEEDQAKIWGNPAVMKKLGLSLPFESVDAILTIGEKHKLVELVMNISNLSDEDDEDDTIEEVEYAKN